MSDNILSAKIRSEDCPSGFAPYYPGKKNRNNPNGTLLSRSEFADQVITDWVRHFTDKERYRRTAWAHKCKYLVQYLKPLGVDYKTAKTKLLDIEQKLANEEEEEVITRSLSTQSREMEIDCDNLRDYSLSTRVGKEFEVDKFLSLSDKELFDDETEIPEYLQNSDKFKKRQREYYLGLGYDKFIEKYDKAPPQIKRLNEFKQKHKQYAERYMEDNFSQSSSQEILMRLPETPTAVINSEALNDRLSHLSFEERSKRLVLQNIKDTITELNKTPEGRKQAEVIMAGVSHEVYGDPGLGLSRKMKDKVRKVKGKLLSGEETMLVAEKPPKRKIFPESVDLMAEKHWLENTIPEPSKQTGKTIEEEGETLPKRYQDRTNAEMYESFKEEYEGKVKLEMIKKANDIRTQLEQRKDSDDKKRRMDYANSLIGVFPSLDWYIRKRPKETKPLTDHTTGLCRLCEAAKINFSTLIKAVKSSCDCGTKLCPNFSCMCPIEDNNEDEDTMYCSCSTCDCHVCMSCKVSYL